MKKRSLVASIAMLVVSAIVLTSATYAWFSTSNRSTVNQIDVSVANGSSNLSVKATGDYAVDPDALPKTALSASDYYASNATSVRENGKKLAAALNPVTMSYADGESAPVFNKVQYDGSTYSNFGAAAAGNGDQGDYLTYDFQVNFENPAATDAYTITLSPTLATGRVNDVNPFTYGMIKLVNGSTTEYYLITPDSEAVVPVVDITASNFGTEETPDLQAIVKENQTNSNSIIDSNDTGSWTAGALTGFDANHKLAKTGGAITYTVPASTTSHSVTVTVYVWAEGQDQNCVGTASATNTGISFSLSAAKVTP